jgi:hypothetical protein
MQGIGITVVLLHIHLTDYADSETSLIFIKAKKGDYKMIYLI